jgi:predicted transcriptional regulator of viral defense system
MTDAIWIGGHSGTKSREHDLDERIALLARRQHGRVARRQLLALGLGRDAIKYRLKHSRLHEEYRGVYALGHAAPTREGRWMSAVLAGGADAVLSHRSAAALWGIRPAGASFIDVTTPRGQHPRLGIRFHRSSLPADEVTVENGIPVSTVPRTLFDLAAVLRPRQLERALGEAEVLRLWDEMSLLDVLQRYPRRQGSRTVRAILQAYQAGATITRSELEVRFLEFVDAAGLPQPETNEEVEGFEVDCVWREASVAVELDARSTHATLAAFERDRERDRILLTAGWHPVRVTWRQLELTPNRLEADLRKLLGVATLAA